MNIFIKILVILLLFNISAHSEVEKDSPFEWNFDIGMESGRYKIPVTDEGDYSAFMVGTRFGFNLGRLFLGAYAKLAVGSFTSARATGAVDRVNNPLPEENATLWGPTLAYKFKWVHFYYSLLFESYKFDSDVDSSGTKTNLFYRYEGVGHEFGLGLRIYGNVFLTYNYRISELSDFKQKIDGVYTPVELRDNPLKINTHVFALRIPINLHKLPGLIQDAFTGK